MSSADGFNAALAVLGLAIVAICGSPGAESAPEPLPPPMALKIDPSPVNPGVVHDPEGEHLLTLVLLGEVAHRSDAEVRAVIGVVLNRLESGRYGDTLESVLMYQRHGVYAFTCLDPVRASPSRNVWARHLPRTREYRRLHALVHDTIERGVNHNFTHYWHPEGMVPLGAVPRWARGRVATRIGSAMFIGG